jgi:hypothetical protein
MPRSSLFAFLLVLLAGCGRSEPPAVKVAQPAVDDIAVAPKEKAVVPKGRHPKQKWAKELTDLDAKVAALKGDDKAKTQELVTWLKARPEYEDSGTSRIGNVWARFSDGRLVAVPFPAPGTRGSGQSPAPPTPPGAAPPGAGPTPRFIIPASRQARLLDPFSHDSFGRALRSPIDDHLVPWLTGAGYSPIRGQGSVDSLRAVKGDGVFYIDTHGVSGVKRGPNEVFGLMTGESVYPDDPAAQAQWEADLDEGRLEYTSDRSRDNRYFMTHKFVKHYMSFSEGAFVFINACSSDVEPAFRQAFLDKGAAVYAGWTSPVTDPTANIVAKFYFDRLLGRNQFHSDGASANQVSREPQIPLESPKQRPFDFASLFHDMQRRNLDLDHLDSKFYDARRAVALTTQDYGLSEWDITVLAKGGVPREVLDKVTDFVGRKKPLSELEKALRERLTKRELMMYAKAILYAWEYSHRSYSLPCHFRVHWSDKVLPSQTGLSPNLTSVYLMPSDTEEELSLMGQFGAGTPRVTVAGVPVEVKRWEGKAKELGMGMVVCSLPPEGPGSAGDVVMTVDGRVSNPVPLTQWRVRLRFTEERTSLTPPLKATGTIDLHFRAGIHSARMIPHETPRPQAGAFSAQMLAALDSQVQWELSGQGRFKNGTETLAWAGAGKMARKQARVPDNKPGQFDVIGQLDTLKKSIRVGSFSILVHKAGTETRTSNGKTTTANTGFSLHANDFTMALDDKFGIVKGEHVWSDDFFKTKLEWDAAPANHPPTAETLSALPLPKTLTRVYVLFCPSISRSNVRVARSTVCGVGDSKRKRTIPLASMRTIVGQPARSHWVGIGPKGPSA